MTCKYFAVCGGCNLFTTDYNQQLNLKVSQEIENFKLIYNRPFQIFKSKESQYRGRGEFKIWHLDNKISYAMNTLDNKVIQIDSCSMVNSSINQIMKPLIDEVSKNEILKNKLFSIEFLSGNSKEVLITLIYHKKLDLNWEQEALKLQNILKCSIIGRSRKQKIILNRDYILETLNFGGENYKFYHLENSFSQPNPSVNEKMVSWVLSEIELLNNRKDLIELYCGAGNFTIPLSKKFKKVLATEVAKSGIATAKKNMELNNIQNITFARLSSEEFTQAIERVRVFNRLKNINLDDFQLNTIFLDPPRAGIDAKTIKLLKKFENIIYISCNPQTLFRDLKILLKDFKIKNMAIFDQFPYTKHLEMGVILIRN